MSIDPETPAGFGNHWVTVAVPKNPEAFPDEGRRGEDTAEFVPGESVATAGTTETVYEGPVFDG